MTQPARLKKQLLRQAVDDNVSTIEGRRSEPARRAPAQTSSGIRWLLLLLPPAVLLVPALYLLQRSEAKQVAPVPPALLAPAEPTTAVAAGEDPASQLVFPAPRPIDARVFPVEVRRVVIDPGHGGEDHGTVGGELAEKNLTLDIARRLRDELEADSFEVLLTRNDDRKLSLRERAELANGSSADLFLSIHINWLTTRQVRGIETYYLGPTEDPELTALARRENRQSGYTLAEMRPILESIYTDFLQNESRRFASRVQRSLFTSLLKANPELENRGVKTAPFVVLVSTEMPAILAEVSCLSNQEEEELLSRPLYRQHIAEALARGVRGYADEVNQTEEKES